MQAHRLEFSFIYASGLLVLLDEHSLRLPQSTFPLIAGIGIGMLFHAPYQVFVKALGPCDLAAGTGAFFLVRFTGATIGLVRFITYTFDYSSIFWSRPSLV